MASRYAVRRSGGSPRGRKTVVSPLPARRACRRLAAGVLDRSCVARLHQAIGGAAVAIAIVTTPAVHRVSTRVPGSADSYPWAVCRRNLVHVARWPLATIDGSTNPFVVVPPTALSRLAFASSMLSPAALSRLAFAFSMLSPCATAQAQSAPAGDRHPLDNREPLHPAQRGSHTPPSLACT